MIQAMMKSIMNQFIEQICEIFVSTEKDIFIFISISISISISIDIDITIEMYISIEIDY
jgi:hypothetical protein